MKNITTVCKNNQIYGVAALFGFILMLPFVGLSEPTKGEYCISSLTFATLERNISYFVQFVPVFLPLFILQVFWGIDIYKNFCVASIYVFSRRSFKMRWAAEELLKLLIRVLAFICVMTFVSLATIHSFPNIIIDESTVDYLIWTVSILTLYTYDSLLLINLLAFFLESGIAFAIVEIINMGSIAIYLLSVNLHIEEDSLPLKMNVFFRMMVNPEQELMHRMTSTGFFLVPAIIMAICVVILVYNTQFTKNYYEGDE